jgi:VCBS repeat-containing protein
MSGYTMTQVELLYTLPAAVTKNTYTTQAVFSAPAATAPVAAIPAGYFITPPASGPGKALWFRAWGTIANTAAATFSAALGFDTTAGTIANSVTMFAASTPTASITAEWDLEAWITARAVGETGGLTLQVDGKWSQQATASGAALGTGGMSSGFSASVTPAGGANQQLFIELFGTWSASSASNTTTINQMFLHGLN